MATCPECRYDELDIENFEQGDTFSCPECGKNLIFEKDGQVYLSEDLGSNSQ
jgi:predicted RNA-binding Zn-ribbon protein involved in translation (DUF1610 family)